MLPVIAIVGRPNVGKSTLFNRMTKSRAALVADFAGLTRDRIYGEAEFDNKRFIVIDTGGIGESETGLQGSMEQQAKQAILEADLTIFLVDGRAGLTPIDEAIAVFLRQVEKPIRVVVNKTDGINESLATTEFHRLGFKHEPLAIAASHNRGINNMLAAISHELPTTEDSSEIDALKESIKIAIVGRPNVGKSTLTNRMLGEDRVVVFDMPGTTRDSVYIPMERDGQQYTLIDTAGVRRRGKTTEMVEKFSVIKTLQAIEDCDVVVVLLDARDPDGVAKQDVFLLNYAVDKGKSILVAMNKWDNLDSEVKSKLRKELQERLRFIDYAKFHFISALHGTGVGDLFPNIKKIYQSATQSLTTVKLNKILAHAVSDYAPPLSNGRRIKIRYVHAGGKQPPLLIFHGNQVEAIPENYHRYLMKFFRKQLRLEGTPLRLQFKNSENPYKDKKNTLTDRQAKKRKRLMDHYKSK